MKPMHAVTGLVRSMVQTTHSGLASARKLRPSAFMNGLGAALGVAVIAVGANTFVPAHATTLMLGAICASVADTPAPLIEKLRRIGLGWVISTIVVFLARLVAGQVLLEGLVAMGAGFCAALVTAYGRNAIPISVSILLALVLSESGAQQSSAPPIVAALVFSIGGLLYAAYAAISTPLLMQQTKRMLLQEALQALAAYIRAQKSALDEGADPSRIFGMLVDSQALLAERIQAARNVIFVGIRTTRDRQMAAEVLVAIDILEAALSEQADLDTLLDMGAEGDELLQALRGLLLIAASELERLSRSVTDPVWHEAMPIADRHALMARILAIPRGGETRRQSVLQATADKIDVLFMHIERLAAAQCNPSMAQSLIGTIDLGPFVQRSIFDWRSLRRELNVKSPIFRYAVRLSLAMLCGALIGSLLPYRAHGSWILLTVALVMRASYSITRQRRNERLMGNVLGCLIAAVALWVVPAWVIPILIFVAVGSAHAFAAQSYLVASIASCVMALLQIHMAEPNEEVFVLVRVVDTAIGGMIAYAFSYLLPHWEHQSVARMVPDLQRAQIDCARLALAVDTSDQSYRLARRRLFDTIAALSMAVTRMVEEPGASVTQTRALSEMLAISYVFAAELASVQVFLRSRADRTDPKLVDALSRARKAVLNNLTREAPPAERAGSGQLTEIDSLDRESYEGAGRLARRLRRVIQVAERARKAAQSTEIRAA
jgi:uncharacterized membrane protein YccC